MTILASVLAIIIGVILLIPLTYFVIWPVLKWLVSTAIFAAKYRGDPALLVYLSLITAILGGMLVGSGLEALS